MVRVKHCNKCTEWRWFPGLRAQRHGGRRLAVNPAFGSTLNTEEKCLKFPFYLWWGFISKPYM